MVILYSDRQIERIKLASEVVAKCHESLRRRLVPGVSTRDVDGWVADFLASSGATSPFYGYQYHNKEPFPGHACISVNDVVVHGYGDDRVLEDGDLVSIDIGAKKDGYIGDSAWTYPIGAPDASAAKLLEVGEEALIIGLRALRPGGALGEACQAIQRHVEEHGFSVVREYAGHGVGGSLHEEPSVPNYVDDRVRNKVFGTRLRAGMVLAIEPMVNEGAKETRCQAGTWPVTTSDGKRSVHFEHTVAIRQDGIEVLTLKENDKLP